MKLNHQFSTLYSETEGLDLRGEIELCQSKNATLVYARSWIEMRYIFRFHLFHCGSTFRRNVTFGDPWFLRQGIRVGKQNSDYKFIASTDDLWLIEYNIPKDSTADYDYDYGNDCNVDYDLQYDYDFDLHYDSQYDYDYDSEVGFFTNDTSKTFIDVFHRSGDNRNGHFDLEYDIEQLINKNNASALCMTFKQRLLPCSKNDRTSATVCAYDFAAHIYSTLPLRSSVFTSE